MKPAVVLAALLAAGLLSGCTGPASTSDDPAPREDGADAPADPVPTSDASREFVLLPGEVVSWRVAVPGGAHLDLRFRVYQGLVDFEVEGPGECEGFRVQAAMVSGPAGADVDNKDCGELPAGTYLLGLHAGEAAFRGAVELRGGWFDSSADQAVPEAPSDERAILVRPGQPMDFSVAGQGKPARLVIGMYSGASLGGSLTGPSPCEADDLSNNVMAASVSGGQILAVSACEVLAKGTQQFHLDPDSSGFYGYVRLYGATFA